MGALRHLVCLLFCLHGGGNCAGLQVQTLDDSGKEMSHTDGTGEISPEVAQMLPASVFKGNVDSKEVHFLMALDVRLFYELCWKLVGRWTWY